MGGSLGEKLAEGAMSDVHAWAPGQVVKLFKAEIPNRIPYWEAKMTQAVFDVGGPAPEVLEKVKVDGRWGIVMPRLDGPTLLQLLQADEMTIEAAGAILATLGLAVHRTPPPADAMALYPYMESSLQLPDGQIPEHIGAGVLELIARLPPEDVLCHCDLHPGNVIVTVDGPRLVDWTGVRRGGVGYDMACCRFLQTELTPEILGDAERQRALDVAVQAEYARLAGLSPEALAASVEAHLPVVRLFFLLGGLARPATRVRLLARLDEDVRGAA